MCLFCSIVGRIVSWINLTVHFFIKYIIFVHNCKYLSKIHLCYCLYCLYYPVLLYRTVLLFNIYTYRTIWIACQLFHNKSIILYIFCIVLSRCSLLHFFICRASALRCVAQVIDHDNNGINTVLYDQWRIQIVGQYIRYI